MDRRGFVWSSVGSMISGFFGARAIASGNGRDTGRMLNAYYFRAHMYTLVPKHVREDMKWMADIGTRAVSVAILEQDLFAAAENVTIIAEAAAKEGMDLFIVPSRWAGIGLMDRGLPRLLRFPIDHLIYYYFPRNVAEPERNRSVIKSHLKRF